MRVNKLTLTRFRGLLNTEIRFQSGFNLIVGVNGVGKSSVLDALRILLAQVMQGHPKAPRFNLAFGADDIMLARDSMQAQLDFATDGFGEFSYAVHKNRELHANNPDGGLRDQTTDTPDKSTLSRAEEPDASATFKKLSVLPLLLYFSVGRSRTTDETPKVAKRANPGYVDALAQDRGLRTRDIAEWWRAREQLADEAPDGRSAKQLRSVRKALGRLLPGYSNWRIAEDGLSLTKQVSIEIEDPESVTGQTKTIAETRELRVQQLSDGERSMVAFVFDLTKRLSQLNEQDDDPAANGVGVVLIDEIDLHLHPAWQRRLAIDLPRVFPNLQFIATTHSPQVIGETEPGRAIVLREGGRVEVQSESLGRDSGWILRHVMETTERNAELQAGLDEVDALIDSDHAGAARARVSELRQRFGDDKELVGAEAAIERWEILGNEEDR